MYLNSVRFSVVSDMLMTNTLYFAVKQQTTLLCFAKQDITANRSKMYNTIRMSLECC